MKAFLLIALVAVSLCYDGGKAKAYADKYWSGANHQCGNYLNCSPYSYFGWEVCGYESHGGDCANFVSQCVLAGGHPTLKGGDCRGYPCGVEEVGATRLGLCLANNFGWSRTCGYMAAPPSNLAVGDVIIYHSGSCSSYDSHAVLVTTVSGGVKISCHSSNKHDVAYTYITDSMPYIEYLHRS